MSPAATTAITTARLRLATLLVVTTLSVVPASAEIEIRLPPSVDSPFGRALPDGAPAASHRWYPGDDLSIAVDFLRPHGAEGRVERIADVTGRAGFYLIPMGASWNLPHHVPDKPQRLAAMSLPDRLHLTPLPGEGQRSVGRVAIGVMGLESLPPGMYTIVVFTEDSALIRELRGEEWPREQASRILQVGPPATPAESLHMHYRRGRLAATRERWPEALAEAAAVLQLQPTAVAGLLLQCEALTRLGREPEARAALASALAIITSNADPYFASEQQRLADAEGGPAGCTARWAREHLGLEIARASAETAVAPVRAP